MSSFLLGRKRDSGRETLGEREGDLSGADGVNDGLLFIHVVKHCYHFTATFILRPSVVS